MSNASSIFLLKAVNVAVRVVALVNRAYDYFRNDSVVSFLKSQSDAQRDYSILRERGPLLRTVEHHGWFLLRYDDVKAALRDERFSSNIFNRTAIRMICEQSAGRKDIPFLDHPWMQQLDPPDHTRVRKLVSRGFTHGYIHSLEPEIQAVVDALLAEIDTDAPFDLVERFSGPLPVLVIAKLLGVPEEDLNWFIATSEKLLGISKLSQPDIVGMALNADGELRDYMATLIRQKRELPGDDLLSKLAMPDGEHEMLDNEDLYATAVFLLVAGHETTTRLITAAIFLLLEHPDQRAVAMQTNETMAQAIEEVARLHPPVLVAPRRAAQHFEHLGMSIEEGHVVGLCLSSANRDPRVFPDPDRFDVTRANNDHLSFGYGIHLCLGMTLGRLEARLAVQAVLSKWPELLLDTKTPDWGDDLTFRGIRELIVRV